MIVETAELLAKLATVLADLVSGVSRRRVPVSDEDVEKVAGVLYPNVARLRQRAAQGQFEVMYGHMLSEYGVVVDPAPVRPYPLDAVRQAVVFASGVEGDDGRVPSVRLFRERLGRVLQQHVANAARELVIDTANLNSARAASDEEQARWDAEEAARDRALDPDGDSDVMSWDREDSSPVVEFPSRSIVQDFDPSDDRDAKVVLEEAKAERVEREREARSRRGGVKGPVLGWARVLVGQENCAFCAMLASRGAVYKSEATAGFVAHTVNANGRGGNCDCECVCVVKGQSWEGEREAALLQDMWEDARDHPTDEEKEIMKKRGELVTPAARFRSRFNRHLRERGMEAFRSDAARLAESRVEEMRRAFRPKRSA